MALNLSTSSKPASFIASTKGHKDKRFVFVALEPRQLPASPLASLAQDDGNWSPTGGLLDPQPGLAQRGHGSARSLNLGRLPSSGRGLGLKLSTPAWRAGAVSSHRTLFSFPRCWRGGGAGKLVQAPLTRSLFLHKYPSSAGWQLSFLVIPLSRTRGLPL